MFPKNLKKGDYGSDVIKLQQKLLEYGLYTYPYITGYFGSVTRKGIWAFQLQNNIPDTGEFDDATRAMLNGMQEKPIPDPTYGLYPLVLRKANDLIKLCVHNGMYIKINEGFRSNERQNALYAQGRTTPGNIVTNAKAGESIHNSRLAFDIKFVGNNPYPNDDAIWKKIADIGVSIGLTAGFYFTKFKDRPHFEYLAGYSEKEILEKEKINWNKFA